MSDTPDANQIAARVVDETTTRTEQSLPADIEAAWDAWSRGVGNVDARTIALLRAAFEVGVNAGAKSSTLHNHFRRSNKQ